MDTPRRFITHLTHLASRFEILVDTDHEGRLCVEGTLRGEGGEAYYCFLATRTLVSKNTDRLAGVVLRALGETTTVEETLWLFKGSELWTVGEHDREALAYYSGGG